MAKFFNGTRDIGQFSMDTTPGRERIECAVSEKWVDIDKSTTVRCGNAGSCDITKSIGLSQETSQTLETSIKSSIGPEAIAQLKTSVQATLGFQVNWSSNETVTKHFAYQAPPCGRLTLTIYQLMRVFNITYWRRRRWSRREVWENEWTRTLYEYTECHDGHQDSEDFDEQCKAQGCKRPDTGPSDGLLSFGIGSTNVRARYHMTVNGFEAKFGNHAVLFEFKDAAAGFQDVEEGFQVEIPSLIIPAPLRFLGNIEDNQVVASVSRIEAAAAVLTPEEALAAEIGAQVVPEIIARSHARLRFGGLMEFEGALPSAENVQALLSRNDEI